MRRRALALAAMVVLAGCGLRTLTILFHTPLACPDVGACPLRATQCVETRLVTQDGELYAREIHPVRTELCTIDDLGGFVFLNRSEASDGIEVIVEARAGEGCDGELVMACDSFGDAVIDLADTDEIPMWCDCPRAVTAP